MFIKQRRVRRSDKFTSRWTRSTQRRREYLATLYTTGVVQFLLIIFVVIGAYRSWALMRIRFPELAWYGKLALPALMIVFAALVARALLSNIRQALDRGAPRPPSEGP